MPWHCGGTGTTEWGRFSSHRRRVEEKCIQAQRSLQGPRLLRRMGWPGTDIDLRFAGSRKTTISLFPFFGAAFFFVFWPPRR